MNSLLTPERVALNGICPYFTMFPLEFPLDILRSRAQTGDAVLDPFCGRGTTNFAARLMGLKSLGVDSSPVAASITAAKLVSARVDDIVAEASGILSMAEDPECPSGEFWRWAFHPSTLRAICQLRAALLRECETAPRIALRGIILGALHGPKQKTFPSYFSNQCPRTYAPKPAYAVQFWKRLDLRPESMDVLALIRRRAERYYGVATRTTGAVRMADSRRSETFQTQSKTRFDWVITSPPYYGMRTYIPDQWLRNWFVGGNARVDYSNADQVAHSSPDEFAGDLRRVWINADRVCEKDARMVVRFGGIRDRRANPLDVIKHSFRESGWRITTIKKAGSAHAGKRQADSFLRTRSKAVDEYDVWAVH